MGQPLAVWVPSYSPLTQHSAPLRCSVNICSLEAACSPHIRMEKVRHRHPLSLSPALLSKFKAPTQDASTQQSGTLIQRPLSPHLLQMEASHVKMQTLSKLSLVIGSLMWIGTQSSEFAAWA